MAKNNGLTNSLRFYNSKTNTFDVEGCFNSNADSIKHALKNMQYIVENPEKFTDDEIKHEADLLADEFYTIVINAIRWEKKKSKIKNKIL